MYSGHISSQSLGLNSRLVTCPPVSASIINARTGDTGEFPDAIWDKKDGDTPRLAANFLASPVFNDLMNSFNVITFISAHLEHTKFIRS